MPLRRHTYVMFWRGTCKLQIHVVLTISTSQLPWSTDHIKRLLCTHSSHCTSHGDPPKRRPSRDPTPTKLERSTQTKTTRDQSGLTTTGRVALPPNPTRSHPPSHLPRYAPPRVSLQPPRASQPQCAIHRPLPILRTRPGAELFCEKEQYLQCLLCQSRMVVDNACVLSAHSLAFFARPAAETCSHEKKMAGCGEVSVYYFGLDCGDAVVLRPADYRSEFQVDGRAVRGGVWG